MDDLGAVFPVPVAWWFAENLKMTGIRHQGYFSLCSNSKSEKNGYFSIDNLALSWWRTRLLKRCFSTWQAEIKALHSQHFFCFFMLNLDLSRNSTGKTFSFFCIKLCQSPWSFWCPLALHPWYTCHWNGKKP